MRERWLSQKGEGGCSGLGGWDAEESSSAAKEAMFDW
jgi:hypothetical protein